MGPLAVRGLTNRYGDVVALDDLTLEVRAGELFGFVGRNGAGKTTTMRIVLGVLAADVGEVTFAGTPLTFEARRRIGYMPEERGLYPKMHLAEQLAYLGELHGMTDADARASALRWLERLGLQDRRDPLQVRPQLRLLPRHRAAVSRRLWMRQDLLQRLPMHPGLRQDLALAHSLD